MWIKSEDGGIYNITAFHELRIVEDLHGHFVVGVLHFYAPTNHPSGLSHVLMEQALRIHAAEKTFALTERMSQADAQAALERIARTGGGYEDLSTHARSCDVS